MARGLRKTDLSFALDAVYKINTALDVPSFARISFLTLRAVIPCTECVLTTLENDQGVPKVSGVFVWGGKTEYSTRFESGDFGHDYFLLRMGLKPNSYAVRDSDLMTEPERMNLKIYREIYEPQGHHYVLRLTLIRDEIMLGQFSLFRTVEQGDFDEFSLEMCDLLASHLALKLDTLMHGSASASPSASLREIYGLTPREQEVAVLAARGLSDDEVAGKLYISNSTVKKHLYNAYSKMGVSNRLQLEIAVTRALEGVLPAE